MIDLLDIRCVRLGCDPRANGSFCMWGSVPDIAEIRT